MKNDFETSAELIKGSFQRLFETLMAQTADRIYIKDTSCRFVFVSEALARTHGLSHRSEIEGMTDFDFFDDEAAQRFYDEEQAIMRTKTPIINLIEKETWKDGTTTWASLSKVPLQLDCGEAIGIIGISRDVTEEYLFKERLKQQNETMLADYASAEKVQQVMIPGRVPHIPGIQMAYIWKPMAAVGGDIINFPRNPQDKLLFFLADVCGHGVQAAFYTVLLKYMTAQAGYHYEGNPKQFLDAVNLEIADRMDQGFVTAQAGHFKSNPETGSSVLTLSNAGQPDLIVQRADHSKAERIKLPSAMVMGIPSGQSSEPLEIELSPGDRVFTFTDGIVEASNPYDEEFGIARLRLLIEATHSLPLQAALDHIYETVLNYCGSMTQQDDISLLAFEVSAAPVEGAVPAAAERGAG